MDERLAKGDVRLSMGGEPTFVSADDMEAAEWNTGAVGPTKRRYADELIRRLQRRFAPGGLLHYGQGKWYPGEQLPRWAFALYWRGDGQPLWENQDLIVSESVARPAMAEDAEKLMRGLCTKLGRELRPPDTGVADGRSRSPMGHRTVGPPPRAAFSCAGRFSSRVPPSPAIVPGAGRSRSTAHHTA